MLSLFTASTMRRRLGMPGLDQAAVVHFQVPTDPWYIFKCPRVVHFGCPPRILKIAESDSGCPWTVSGNGGTFPLFVQAQSNGPGVIVNYNTTCSPVSPDLFSVAYGTDQRDPDTWCLFDVTYTGAPQFNYSVSGGNKTNCLIGHAVPGVQFDYATLPSGTKSHHKH